MSDEDNKSPPPLDSGDEDVESQGEEIQTNVGFSASASLSPSKVKKSGETTATPSNTPVVSLFSKVPAQSGTTKRSFEGAVGEQKDKAASDPERINELLNALSVSGGKKAPQAAPTRKMGDPEDDDEDEDEDDDDEDGGDEEDDEEEEEYVATQEQIASVLPMLRENQHLLKQVTEDYQKARRELELKFQGLRASIYKDRAALVAGTSDGAPDLPGFWLDAMRRNMLLSQYVEEWDEPALMFLDNVEVNDLKDEFGFELTFHFAKENPFFTNETLKKKLIVSNLYAPDYVMPNIDESIGTEIKWNADKNLTVKIEVKEVKRAARKGGKKGGVKEVRQETPQDSFFTFFKTRTEKSPEEQQEMNEDEQDAYQRDWEMDFAIASTFRSKLIPDATLWYTGEASDSEYDYDEDEEDEDDEDDEDEDEFEEMDEDADEDDEEDEEDEKPAKKGGKKGGAKGKPLSAQGAGGKEGEPECKQQ